MLVVVRLGDDAMLPCGAPLGLGEHADRVAEAARHLSAVARDHHLVVTYGFDSRLGPPSLERALACRLPADRLATVPIRVVVGAHDAVGPRSIVELRTFRILVDSGVTVLCPGDACIPVRTLTGALRAVGAVMDGDVVAGRLATEFDADALLLLIGGDTTGGPAGGTGPKIEALREFVGAGGWLGAVGPLFAAAEMLRSGAGVVEWGLEAMAPLAVRQG